MKKIRIVLAAYLLVVAGGYSLFGQDAAPGTSPSGMSESGEIKMTAKKYAFDPAEIRVRKDQRVKLVITALDREHGFKLEAFDIDQKLSKGEPAAIEFVADKAGTFPFQCSRVCGLGHRKMKGRLIVE